MTIGRIVLLAAALMAAAPWARAAAAPFLAGADLSLVAQLEKEGCVYRDKGAPRDILAILKSRGCNVVRLRLWTAPPKPNGMPLYSRLNDLEYTLPLARRVKRAGLKLLLDVHYSDTWADPSHQDKPAAWRGLAFDKLVQQVHDYSRDLMDAFRKAGAAPDIVQVGNEITPGMLWPDGRVGGDGDQDQAWARLGALLRAGVAGMREGAGRDRPLIMIHSDRGGSWGGARWFFDNVRKQGVEYDLIGLSYYPFWHGTLDDLAQTVNGAAERYGKPVVVVETAYPWSGGEAVRNIGLPSTPEGQRDYVSALVAVMRRVPGGLGRGIVWWAAEYIPGSSLPTARWEDKALFDRQGNALPALAALGAATR